ncbi:MAG TPA: DsbA family protein [Chryseosolibacter sp.]
MIQQQNGPEVHLDQQRINQDHLQKNPVEREKGRVKVEFYTDPLCCWSWAFEKPWRQLLTGYGDKISYRYVMCGMIRDWQSYDDAMNAVSRPLQMGPVWMHASEMTQVKMRYDVWHLNPPSSSYPACIAVKTAGLQSDELADQYLYAIRVSLMEEAADISRHDVLLSIARTIPSLDFARFENDWNRGLGKNAFRYDLQQARYHGISRFPTLTFTNGKNEGFMIVGYRPFEALQQAFENILAESSAELNAKC